MSTLFRLLGVALVFPLLALAAAAAETRKPNIILIVGDDMGYADIGVHGCKDIPTPHIDSLAKNGVRCTSGYVSGPYCSPTRAGLLTGRYQQRFGHEFNPGPNPKGGFGLDLAQTTLANRLKAGGYKTGMVGKWHLGTGDKYHPLSRGFDEFFGFLGGAHPYLPNARGRTKGILRGREEVDEKEYLTDAFAREAKSYIERHSADPFFLYLTFNAVHTPMEATDKYLARFREISDPKRKSYAAMMSAMDDAIGQVLATLQEKKLEENTLVFFISDNGGPTQANGSDNRPLTGVKATTWEGGIRVPFLAQWKGKLPGGGVFEDPVIQLDLVPTALAAAGVKLEDKLDGVNLLPYLHGESTEVKAPPHEALFWRMGPQAAMRKGEWKITKARGQSEWGLYNLATDLGESQDLSADKPEKRKELIDQWTAWSAELSEPKWEAPRQGKQAKQLGKKNKKKAAQN